MGATILINTCCAATNSLIEAQRKEIASLKKLIEAYKKLEFQLMAEIKVSNKLISIQEDIITNSNKKIDLIDSKLKATLEWYAQ